jgi:DNA-binding MarR family transcriptional regulator
MSLSELAAQLRPRILRLNRMIRMQRVEPSMTLTQLSALGTIWARGPLSAGDLAGFERVQPPSMTKVLAALEESGLVRREAHPTDKRQAIIAITPAGEALLESERQSGNAWLCQQLAKLDDDERGKLARAVAVLDKIAEQ